MNPVRYPKDARWTVNLMVDGIRIHRLVGWESDGTTRTQAEEYIEKVKQDAKHDRLTLPKGRKVALSFAAAAEKYLHKLEQEGGKDLKTKRRRLEQHLVPYFGDRPLSKITTFNVEQYKKHRRAEKAVPRKDEQAGGNDYRDRLTSEGTVNLELAVLSHLFGKAIEWGWLREKPAAIKKYKVSDGRIVYLTVEQIRELLKEAKADQSLYVYPFIMIGLGTGMRMMEILSIRKEDVDLERRIIHIPKAKAGAREQPMPPELAAFLKTYMARSLPKATPWLFPASRAKDGHAVSIRKPFCRVVEKVGLDPKEIIRHTLRHTAITHLVQSGVDLPTVMKISGHKTLVMVQKYAHADSEHIQAAMKKLHKRYQGAV